MARKVSEGRKSLYLIGNLLGLVGLILFLSVFIGVVGMFGDFGGSAQAAGKEMGSVMMRGVVGMILMIVGGAIRNVGHGGLAGSGAILDPERAREELEPHARMTGGLVKDGLDEAGIDLSKIGGGGSSQPEKVIMIKCRHCAKLNEEDSKFCQECGQPI